ncbi:MAG: hypothetical protein IKP04_03015, partial [Candidatus Methanomethylophilaceae archaeon]|nr:hypothetical protein [Candidatus Methanomethylophilaceae archaeon]
MNTKGTKILAVLAVLAMAFAAVAVITPAEQDDAASTVIDNLTPITDGAMLDSTSGYYYANSNVKVKINATSIDDAGWAAIKGGTYTDAVKIIILKGCTVEIENTGSTTPAVSAWVALTEEAGTTSGTKKVTIDEDASDRNLWFDVGDKSVFQTVQVGSDWRIYLGPTSSELNIDNSTVEVTGDWKTCPINLKTGTDSVLIAINLTAEIHSEATENGTIFKVTKFSGEISWVSDTELSIDKWTSGDIEVVESTTSVLKSDIPTGSTLYVDAGANFGTTSNVGEIFSLETPVTALTNNGTINIKQTKDSSGVSNVGYFELNVEMVNKGVINNLGEFAQYEDITNEGKITTGEDGLMVTWSVLGGEVINNGTFTFKETTALSSVKFSSKSTGDVKNQAASNKDVSGTITSDTYGWNQSATIIGTSTLTGTLELDGLLTINEGVTLTITGDGKIVLGSPQSVIINNGTIVVQDNKGIDNQKGFIYNYGKMTFSDPSTTLDPANPTLKIGGTDAAFLKNYGTITNSVGYVALNEGGSFMNQSGASFISNSFLDLGNGALISNAGKIQIDGTVNAMGADQAIALTDKDATVQIVGLILPGGGLTITNETGVGGAVGSVVLATTHSTVPSDHTDLITGLNVATYDKGKALIVSGNVSLYSDTYGQTVSESYIITLEGTTAYIGDLTLQEKVLLAGENETFKVVGTLVAANPGSAAIQNMNTNGTITVDGKIITNVSPLSGYKNLNAAMYQTISESFIKTYYYTTLPNAVAEASDLGVAEVTIYGSLEVKSDLTIPAPLIVKNQGILTIKDGANVTVADGAELNNGGTIYVNGSLYAYKIEDISGNTTSIAIVSDVKVVGSEDVLYTNLYSALEAAEAGDTVVITKDDGCAVKLSKDTTIPVGVTLDTNEKALDTNGKKLIVNGTLALYAAGSFTSYEDVTLNGYIVSDDQRTYSSTGLAGAYYSTDVGSVDRYYIAGIKNLADITASGVTEIAVHGEISTAAIAFSGAEEMVTVTFYDNVDVTTMTATKAVVVFNSGSTVKATVTDGDNSVALVGDVPSGKNLRVTLGDSFKVGGDFDAVTTEASKYVFTLSGTSTIDALNVYNLRVDGTATTAGAVVIVNDLVVTGSLTVAEGKTLSAKNAMVTGSIDAIGAATITNVTIGSTSNAVKAVADVSGKVTATVVVLFAGNTVDSEIIEDMKFTEFYVDGKLWFTVYSNGLVELNDLTVPVTDAIAHPGHYDDLIVGEDGKLSGTLTPGDKASYDLAVDYEIYNVTIITDAGIKAVYINGKVMASPASGLND